MTPIAEFIYTPFPQGISLRSEYPYFSRYGVAGINIVDISIYEAEELSNYIIC